MKLPEPPPPNKRILISAGYEALNGHIFTESQAEDYNRIQRRINVWIDERGYIPETLLDESHKKYCLITGMTGG